MRAMVLNKLGSLDDNPSPLKLQDVPQPTPARGEVVVRILACGVCHTELDIIEGRTPPPNLPLIPGHQVIGYVCDSGPESSLHEIGTRVGVGWIHSSDGTAAENVSTAFRATGRDCDGGYAEWMTVPEAYAFRIPDEFDDVTAAPLLCAGAVGFRALRLTGLTDGEVLGLTGFGGSGHLVLQMSRYLYPKSPVFVFARSPRERAFAKELGASWTGGTDETPPQRAHAIIDTTPAWFPVIAALECLRPGGRLVINAIRKEGRDADLLSGLSYENHLWMEKEIKTVANITGTDLAEFLPLAAGIPLRVETEAFALEEANQALIGLRHGDLRGAKVLII